MHDEQTERSGAPHEFPLFEDVGRWIQERDTRREQASADGEDPAFESFPDDGAEALIDRALRARGIARPVVSSTPTEQPANGPSLWSVIYGLATAAAIVGTFMVSMPRPTPHSELGLSSTPLAGASGPLFASMRIDGGGPSPLHQGQVHASPTDAQLLCQDRTMQLVLAAPSGQTLDPVEPLELTLEAMPPWGPSVRFSYLVGPNERFTWVDSGRAVVFSGTLEELAPLTPGPWALHMSAGAPGACSQRGQGSGCSSLEVRTIEVIARDQCDARR